MKKNVELFQNKSSIQIQIPPNIQPTVHILHSSTLLSFLLSQEWQGLARPYEGKKISWREMIWDSIEMNVLIPCVCNQRKSILFKLVLAHQSSKFMPGPALSGQDKLHPPPAPSIIYSIVYCNFNIRGNNDFFDSG